MTDIRPRDEYEGTGTHRVRLRVLEVGDKDARCLLLRSSPARTKWVSLRTLQAAYKLTHRPADEVDDG